MDNLWLLTEERPKPSVILQIIEMYCSDFNDRIVAKGDIKIKPIIESGKFKFTYVVENLKVGNAESILSRLSVEVRVFLIFYCSSKRLHQ